uniref:ATP synthase subunit delta, chloroplastic n=1 Tax=Cyanidiaceae sp. MX-AZ01 TaxID=1503164 RepID=A0A060A999_9RHOD|nr:ATP synthase CF1 delta chain [Cyanidiaceae sp. MX-AZ01]
MKQKIVEPYAQALFTLRDDLDLTQLCSLVKEKQFMQILLNPSISKANKMELFKSFDPIIQSWLEVIWTKKRIQLLPEICEYYLQLCKKKAGIACISITSATVLTDTQTQKLEEKLKQISGAKHLECSYEVDKQLIAGLRIQLDGKLLDTSWQTQLKQLQQFLNTYGEFTS